METKITKQKVLAQEEKLYQAMKTSDVKMLEGLLHADLLFLLPSGELITKAMDLQSYKEGLLSIQELTATVEQLNIIVDTAVISIRKTLKGLYNKEQFVANYRYIRCWKQRAAGLQVIGGSGILIAP